MPSCDHPGTANPAIAFNPKFFLRKNKRDCCLGNLVDASQCVSEWCPGNAACSSFTDEFCSNVENALQPQCVSRCTTGDATSRPAYCETNMNSYCRSFAPGSAPALCDCLLSSERVPACFDIKCANTNAYKSPSMLSTAANCPSWCEQIVNTGNIGEKNKFLVRQICPKSIHDDTTGGSSTQGGAQGDGGDKKPSPASPSSDPSSNTDTPTPPTAPESGSKTNTAIVLGIGAAVLLLIALLIFAFTR